MGKREEGDETKEWKRGKKKEEEEEKKKKRRRRRRRRRRRGGGEEEERQKIIREGRGFFAIIYLEQIDYNIMLYYVTLCFI